MICNYSLICIIITIIVLLCISLILIYGQFNGKIQPLRNFGGYEEGDIKRKILNAKYNNDV